MQLLERGVERLIEHFLAPREVKEGLKEDKKRISGLRGNFKDSIEALLKGYSSISFNTKIDWASCPSWWTPSIDFPSLVEVRASKHHLRSQYSFSIAAGDSPQSPPLLEFRLRGDTFTVFKENRPLTIVEGCLQVDKLDAEIDGLEAAFKVVRLVTEARQIPS